MKDFPASLHFLMTCSLESLQSFEIRRLDEAAHLLRKLVELATDLTRAQTEAQVAHLILANRQLPIHPIRPTRQSQLPAAPFQFPVLKPGLHAYSQPRYRPLSIETPHSSSPPPPRPVEPMPLLFDRPISLAFAT